MKIKEKAEDFLCLKYIQYYMNYERMYIFKQDKQVQWYKRIKFIMRKGETLLEGGLGSGGIGVRKGGLLNKAPGCKANFRLQDNEPFEFGRSQLDVKILQTTAELSNAP